jgi:hypothetical protein
VACGAFATIAISYVVVLIVTFVFAGVCNEPPGVRSMVLGRAVLWLVIVGLGCCWGVATHAVLPRWRMVVLGGLAMLPIVLLGIWSLSDDFWVGSGGYCF